MTTYTWSYEVKAINGNIDLLEGRRKFGVLYGDIHAEDRARLITSAQEMYRILCELKEYCKNYDLTSDLECDIYEVLALIDGKEGNS